MKNGIRMTMLALILLSGLCGKEAAAFQVSFNETAETFTFTIVGGAIDSDYSISNLTTRGYFWDVFFNVAEDDWSSFLDPNDKLRINGYAVHHHRDYQTIIYADGWDFDFQADADDALADGRLLFESAGDDLHPLTGDLDQYTAHLLVQTDFTFPATDNITGYWFTLNGEHHSAPVPVPGAVWLLGSGLVGLIGIRRSRKLL